MKGQSPADIAYWAAVAVLSVVVLVLAGMITVYIAIPELERSGMFTTAVTLRPSPTPAATAQASPSGLLAMGQAVVPADGDCAGCHTTPGGAIGPRAIPVIAHAVEGWNACTSCHAKTGLVKTAPGHAGIHASECLVCHRPGDLPAPLSRPHRENQNQACLTCHGETAPLPADMTHRSESVCWLCHRLPTIEPPVPAHETSAGEADCRTCHKAGGEAGALPGDHVDRPARLCLSCHEVTLGAAPGSTPRIQVWPAPSSSPQPSRAPLVPLGSLPP